MNRAVMHDQAAGLRNLSLYKAYNPPSIFTIAGGGVGVGKTSVAINLGRSLARNGYRVLLIDECANHNNICSGLGINTRFELLHVIQREKRLDEVILQGPENVSVLLATRGINVLNKLNANEQNWLVESFSGLADSIDIVIVDTKMTGTTHVLPFSLASEQVVVVISGSAASLTGAYALIKILSQEYAKQHFLILVNKTDSEDEALTIFNNLAQTARQYLAVTLELIGYIQKDAKLHDATQLSKPVVDAFPASLSAAGFRQVAQNVLNSSCPDKYTGGVESFMQRLIRTSHFSMTNFTV